MADPIIRVKRSTVPGRIPTTTQLGLGEIGINHYDGKLFIRQDTLGVGIGTTVIVTNPWSVGPGTSTYNTYFTNGFVGIGTTNPQYQLDLDTRLYVKSRTDPGDGSTGIDISSGASSNIITGAHRIRTAGGSGKTLAIEAVTGLGQSGGGRINFVTNENVRVAISSLGTVLIGGDIASQNTVGNATTAIPLQVTGGVSVTNSVGIGTTNPLSDLHINRAGYAGALLSSGEVSGLLYASSIENAVVLRNNSTTTGSGLALAGQSSAADLIIFRATRNVVIGDNPPVASQTGTANQKLQVQSGAYVSGNLGIGATNPQSKLHVQDGVISVYNGAAGTISTAIQLYSSQITNASNTGQRLEFRSDTVNGYIEGVRDAAGGPAVSMRFGTAYGEAIRITGSTLNVGIGITTPTSKLHVAGDALITGSTTSGGFIGNLTGNVNSSGVSTVGSLNIGATQVISSGRQLQNIASLDATTTATIESAIANAPNNFNDLQVAGISTFTNGPVLVGTGTSTGTASQPLQVTGGAYVSGNLGVGVTNPVSKTHIAISGFGITTALTLDQTNGNAVGANFKVNYGGYETSRIVFDYVGGEFGALSHGMNYVSGRTGFSNHWFRNSSNATQMVMNNSGNLLIGTETDSGTTSQKLQVTGGAYVSGNVGVGTTRPLQNLHVQGNLLVAAGSSTGQHITQKAYEVNNGTLSWEGSAGQLFSITNNLTSGSIFSVNDVSGIPSIDVDANGTIQLGAYGGNIGVGTTSPSSKLTVAGNALITGIATVSSNLVVNGNTLYVDATNNRVGILTTSPSQPLQVGATGTNVVVIDSTGDLGLGITNPSYRLHVRSTGNGGIGQTIAWFTDPGGLDRISIVDETTVGTKPPGIRSKDAAYGLGLYSNGGPIIFYNGAADTARGRFDTSGNFLINATSATGTASQPLQVTGGAYVSGNVGVGVTNPGSSLTVKGSAIRYISNFDSNTGILLSASGTERPHVSFRASDSSERGRIEINGINGASGDRLGLYSYYLGNIYEVVSIFGGGAVCINNTALTGTASQTLQVTGGGYLSGSVGIGTTNPSAQLHITGQFQSTQANSTTTGGGQIYLNGATGNRIDFNQNGTNAPTFTTRSTGTKIVLYPTISASAADHAFGIENGANWYSVPTTVESHKWYAGTTNIATLSGVGSFSIGGGISGATASPTRLETGNNYSNGATRDKCKIYLYNVGTEQYGFGVGSNGDIQYHSNSIHEFYIANNAAVRINGNRNLLIGSQTDTGTASQRLQVSGGAYVSSNTGIGTTNPQALLSIGSVSGFQDTTTTLATTTATTIDSFSTTVFRSARVQVQISQSTNYQISDVLVIHDGTTASIVEYASVATNDYIGSLTATVSGGNCLLQVSMLTATSTTVKVLSQRITI